MRSDQESGSPSPAVSLVPPPRKPAKSGQHYRQPRLGSPFVRGALVLAALLCMGCGSKEPPPPPPPPGVLITPVVQKDVPITQEWVGTMVGNTDADIRPKVEGFLLTRLYQEGSFVEKGQALFQLDKRQAQAAVEQATGNLERAQAALS